MESYLSFLCSDRLGVFGRVVAAMVLLSQAMRLRVQIELPEF